MSLTAGKHTGLQGCQLIAEAFQAMAGRSPAIACSTQYRYVSALYGPCLGTPM